MVMKLARFSQLPTIAFIILVLQQSFPSTPPPAALALRRSLNDSWHPTQNGSSPVASNSTSFLPDPSHCDSPQSAHHHLDSFFFANSTEKQLSADANLKGILASNFSKTQNLTQVPHMLKDGNVSDCGNASSATHTKSPDSEQIQDGAMEASSVMHVDEGVHARTNNTKVAVAHVAEDAPLYAIASMHAVVKGQNDVLLLNEEQLKGTTHIADPSSAVVKDSVQVMVINDDDVVLVEAEQLNGATAPATRIGAHISSAAKESVQVMDVGKDGLILIDAQQLGHSTPPPGSPSIHTAGQISVARESVQVMDVSKGDVFWINEEQLGGSTPPPGDSSIHTAAQSSVARESVQVMVIDEDDVVLVNTEQLRHLTPPPIDSSIHMAGQNSVAKESEKVLVISDEDGEVSINEEQLGASSPPPGDYDIHTASESSFAMDSSFHEFPPLRLSEHDNQDAQLLRA